MLYIYLGVVDSCDEGGLQLLELDCCAICGDYGVSD